MSFETQTVLLFLVPFACLNQCKSGQMRALNAFRCLSDSNSCVVNCQLIEFTFKATKHLIASNWLVSLLWHGYYLSIPLDTVCKYIIEMLLCGKFKRKQFNYITIWQSLSIPIATWTIQNNSDWNYFQWNIQNTRHYMYGLHK